ncbi:MAG: DUF177 domain-containing protein [Leptothrix sp. (in: b-proteobacteria)]
MKTDFKPSRLDIQAFADAAGHLEGTTPLLDLERLHDLLRPDASAAADGLAHWNLRGEVRKPRSGPAQVWLNVSARASVPLECQRCLGTVSTPLIFDRWYRFADTEDEAAALDEQEDDDVLVTSRHFDAIGLVEDEILLDLPVVPKHEGDCPEPLPMPTADLAADEAAVDETPHPFAQLAGLRSVAKKSS